MIKNKDLHQEYVFDFSNDGSAVATYNLKGNKLPSGAKVYRVEAHVESAVTSGGAATVSIGDLAAVDTYMAATAKASLGAGVFPTMQSVVPKLIDSANEQQITASVGTAALTAGKIRVVFHFTMQG